MSYTALISVTKSCRKCGETKPIEGFIKNKQCRGGRAGTCMECDKHYKDEYYSRNIRRKREVANKLNRERKERAIAHMGGKCEDCGGVFHRCVYDFHHIGDKDGNPSKFLTFSWERALAELQKCVLLCANCHRLRHFKEGSVG